MPANSAARRARLAILAAAPLVLACTAVGAWVYDDPTISLRSAQLHPRKDVDGMSDSLELVFVACNRNDYELRSEGFETRLAVAGQMVGQGGREYPLFLGMRDTARFSVTVPVHDFDTSGASARRFELTAHSKLLTPMGNRPFQVRLHGRVREERDQLVWREEGGAPCRPGLSALPNQFSQPTLPDQRPRDEPPNDRPGQTGRPGERP